MSERRTPRRRPRRPWIAALPLALVATLSAGCTPRPDDPAGAARGNAPAALPGGGTAESEGPVLVYVDRIEVLLLKSFPVQIEATLVGNLADACVETAEPEVVRDGTTFVVTVPATRPADRMCAQALVPFQQTVPLPVRDLPRGEYRIESHGASATFTLSRDNSFNPR